MTSILTNTASMIALQTLKSINKDLGTVQEQVSSGKKVGSAKDDAATWAISKVMESDVTSFKKIAEGLSVGASTVAVARQASETVVKFLDQMKGKIVQAQAAGQGQDKVKLQADIDSLVEQIKGVVGAAQFNGVNLINGSSGDVKFLAALNRSANGNISSSLIQVERQNLSIGSPADSLALFGTSVGAGSAPSRDAIISYALNGGSSTANIGATPTRVEVNTTENIEMTIASVANKQGYSIKFEGVKDNGTDIANTFVYVADDKDSTSSVARGLQVQIENFLAANGVSSNKYTVTAVDNKLKIVNNTSVDMHVTVDASTNGTVGTGGTLAGLNNIDVTSPSGATAALAAVDGFIKYVASAAAAFGTAENQLTTQNEFVGKLITSLQTGIGAMIDADMEEASARLQALQTQQQLGIQSLAIANQAPAAIMALFR